MRNLKDIFLWDETEALNGELEIALESIMDGDDIPAFNHVCRLIREELDAMPKETHDRILYRFVGFPTYGTNREISGDEILEDIKLGRITLSNPMSFNDPMDPIIRVRTEERQKLQTRDRNLKRVAELIHEATAHFRICSLVGEKGTRKNLFNRLNEHPYENVLMWGHYAKCHTGICIKYRIKPQVLAGYTNMDRIMLLGDVRYREQKELNNYITLNNALLAKSGSWKYERETRLIYFTTDEKDLKDSKGDIMNYVPMSGFEIESIYMGCKMNKRYKQALWQAIQGKHIDLYQMEFDMDDITKIRARKTDAKSDE